MAIRHKQNKRANGGTINKANNGGRLLTLENKTTKVYKRFIKKYYKNLQ